MAELTETERRQVWRGIMRYVSAIPADPGHPLYSLKQVDIEKADLFAAIEATDAWIEDNQIGFNNALPEPAKTDLNVDQKTFIFMAVTAMRVDPAFARAIIGDIS